MQKFFEIFRTFITASGELLQQHRRAANAREAVLLQRVREIEAEPAGERRTTRGLRATLRQADREDRQRHRRAHRQFAKRGEYAGAAGK